MGPRAPGATAAAGSGAATHGPFGAGPLGPVTIPTSSNPPGRCAPVGGAAAPVRPEAERARSGDRVTEIPLSISTHFVSAGRN